MLELDPTLLGTPGEAVLLGEGLEESLSRRASSLSEIGSLPRLCRGDVTPPRGVRTDDSEF